MHKDSQATYHLTSNGWTLSPDAPPDRVETWSCSVRQLSSWSREYIDWRCVWANPTVSVAERETLRKTYRQIPGSPGRYGGTIITIGNPL
jgi:hypothetical protein